jgi:hypothetical protein
MILKNLEITISLLLINYSSFKIDTFDFMYEIKSLLGKAGNKNPGCFLEMICIKNILHQKSEQIMNTFFQ